MANVTQDTFAQGKSLSANVTVNLTVGANADRKLFALIYYDDVAAITSVKWNNESPGSEEALIKRVNSPTTPHTEIWELINPLSGNHDLFVNNAQGAELLVIVLSLYNCKQVAVEATASDEDAGTVVNADITTITNNAWVVSAVGRDPNGTITPNSGQTEIDQADGGLSLAVGREEIATAGLITDEWSLGASVNGDISLVAVQPSGADFQQALSGTLTFSGIVTTKKVITQALSGVLTFSGAVLKKPKLKLSGTLNFSGAVARSILVQVTKLKNIIVNTFIDFFD